MCYRILADAEKDVSKLSSKKEESAFTPREGIDGRETASLVSESGVAAMFNKLHVPFKGIGGISAEDDIEMKSGAVKREVEKVD